MFCSATKMAYHTSLVRKGAFYKMKTAAIAAVF